MKILDYTLGAIYLIYEGTAYLFKKLAPKDRLLVGLGVVIVMLLILN